MDNLGDDGDIDNFDDEPIGRNESMYDDTMKMEIKEENKKVSNKHDFLLSKNHCQKFLAA